jgi:hypothetical protein
MLRPLLIIDLTDNVQKLELSVRRLPGYLFLSIALNRE